MTHALAVVSLLSMPSFKGMSKSLCASTCPVHHAKDGDEKVAAQNLLSVVHDTF